jgi:glutamate-1-semialdehyde 2,1-aminomutase
MTEKAPTSRSQALYAEALGLLPGGVDSPVRAFAAVGGGPRFIERGAGAYLYDVDGNRLLDYVLSWGPLILGHAHPRVVSAIVETAQRGTSFGAPSPLELDLARLVRAAVPSVEMIRFVNSGTEAAMSALRLARAFTGRNGILKFDGGYHGHADMLLVKAGSGVATLGLPDSPGVPAAVTADTVACGYNDLESVKETFRKMRGRIAAVIVEPVAGNMGVVPPEPGFLEGLRAVTAEDSALLVFDEVMTGFRVHPGGAQALYGIRPDLTVLGKVIGGGLPVGAYGGRRDIMSMIAPAGPVYQAGTLSGNPLAMAAGIATLKELAVPGTWENLVRTTKEISDGIAALARAEKVPLHSATVGSMFGSFFSAGRVVDWPTARGSNLPAFRTFFHHLLDAGVSIAPSQFEAGFVSTAHGKAEVTATLEAAAGAFRAVARGS